MAASVEGGCVWVVDIEGSGVIFFCGDEVGVLTLKAMGMSACRIKNSVTTGSSVEDGELPGGEGGASSVDEARGSGSCSSGGSLCRLVLALSFPKTLSCRALGPEKGPSSIVTGPNPGGGSSLG